MEQRFTSNEVMALTGLSARQLQWWDERGLVVPLREGHRRLYSLDDVAEVAVICDLRRRGFSLQRVRVVIRFLQKEFGKRLVEAVSAASDYHLLTDGKRLFLETSPQQVIDILKNSRQPMFTICLSDTVRQIRAELPAMRPEAAPQRRTAGARSRERKTVRSDSGARRLRARRVS
jgi:DNA-binding transcriptional MerR regulator